ncbi:MAG: DUF3144 domain-containing protein [Desulfuromonas sp.]|uniref:DUF3144 domain-containing protein n=1 Tax=Desulfuromonas sp. TaxID=892 RepID=UPI000CA9D60F|nr:DUF3144 domain-containing protein [Desulfuromonas sp.]PLX86102.1 MAG: DUF3144 domain-containing protein [Desulfuromonas sp.]
MSDEIKDVELFDMADQFIAVANRLVQENGESLGLVSAAFRYAAARFSAHEASHKSKNLVEDKEKALAWFTEQYKDMLSKNLDQHIEHKRNQIK